MSKLRILTIALVSLLFASWLLIPPVTHYVAQNYIFDLQRRGVKFNVEGLEGRRIGVAANAVEVWTTVGQGASGLVLPPIPLSLTAENVEITASIPPLQPWVLGARFRAGMYGGLVEGTVRSAVSSPTLSLVVSGVNLAQHPQLGALGIESGSVDATIVDHPLSGSITRGARYSVEAHGINITLPPIVAQYAKVQSLSDARVRAVGELKTTGDFNVSQGEVVGSFGNASMTARGNIDKQQLRQISGTLDVNLDGPDGEKLRPWAALLIQSNATAGDSLQCRFRSNSCSAKAALQIRVGPTCILFSCS